MMITVMQLFFNKRKVTFGIAVDKQNAFCLLNEQWTLEDRKHFVAL